MIFLPRPSRRCRPSDEARRRGKSDGLYYADFGIAHLSRGAEAWMLTSSHVAMGTMNYMAPEQKLDAKAVDCRAKKFSLGVILYEMLTGELPLESFDPPSRFNPKIPRALDEIVPRCLRTNAQDRYPSVSELAEDLRPTGVAVDPAGRLQYPLAVSAGLGRLLVLDAGGERKVQAYEVR